MNAKVSIWGEGGGGSFTQVVSQQQMVPHLMENEGLFSSPFWECVGKYICA
jgi:hypothetical protein